jgi:ABC-2 type transport system permease protein/oleandomycin transport system permease protein
LTFSFVQPLWWLLLFGPLFAESLATEARAGLDYRSFVSPGVSLMTLLFGASQAGISLLRDAQTGMLARMLHTATPAAPLLLGKLAADVARFALLALCVLGLGVLLGARLSPSMRALPSAALAFVAAGALFASLSCMVAALAREPEVMGAYVHVVNLPILFTSSVLVPSRVLPSWLAWLAQVNPLSLTAEAWRALWLGLPPPSPEGLLALLGGSALSFALAAWALVRAGRSG